MFFADLYIDQEMGLGRQCTGLIPSNLYFGGLKWYVDHNLFQGPGSPLSETCKAWQSVAYISIGRSLLSQPVEKNLKSNLSINGLVTICTYITLTEGKL